MVVFLHGIQGTRALFSRLMSEPFFDNHDLLALDFFGFGDSSKPSDWCYNLESHAHTVEQVFHQLQVKEVIVVGHSLGGMVGTLLLNSSSLKVVSLVSLEGNLLIEDCGMSKEVALLSLEEFSSTYFAAYKEKLQRSKEVSAEFRTSALDKADDVAFYRTSRSIVDWSKSGKLKDAFENVACSKLLVTGASSSFHSQVNSEWCKEVSVEDSGHFLLNDNYDQTKQVIQNFLEDQSSF
jgi:pimeloyl-ACP methyl ester carboxylesterase